MWRKGGKLVSYVYNDCKSKDCGEDWPWDAKCVPGKWHEISVYCKVNDVGAHLTIVVFCLLLLTCRRC